MTIILFLIDTSASMCQKAHVNGVQKTYLDIAKGAVETFLKYRQRSQDCMGDRYMLLTFEDPPCNVKAGWKENHATFMNELKNLQSNGLTSMGEALKNAFDLLNLNRMQSGIDTYGQGRCPFYLEPSVIIVITDGGKYSYRNGVHSEIVLPLNAQIPGTKLTKEPFRWDQRLFSLVLRMPGNKMDERVEGKVPPDDSPIEKMCEVTGGRSYRVRSHYVLNQCIESLVQKVQPGVVIHFEQIVPKDIKDGEIQDLAFQQTKKMIYVQKHPTQKTFPVGCWPIPEPYWPDPKAITLPPRDAHPKIRIITPAVEEPPSVRNFPIDKYELEACPLTLQVLSKKEPNKIWPVVVATGGGGHAIELPFGYLKANSTYTVVHFYILPYNYQTLLPLINDLFHKFNFNPPNDWVYKFSNYVKSIPQYYCPFLRRALASTQVPYPLLQYILPENLDSYLSPTIANYLKTMKNTAKQDQENLCLRVFKQLKVAKPAYHQVETVKLNCGLQLKRDLVTHPMLKQTFTAIHSEINMYENYTIVVPTQLNSISTKNYRNPFDIPRKDLIDEISRMRDNFFKVPTTSINLYTKDAGHSLPISEMGNYQEYLKNKDQPLRELEPTNVRQHMFGNPYKKDKNMVMVDEADLGDVAPMKSANMPISATASPTPGNPLIKKIDPTRLARKRKAGPIRKDYIFRRTSTGEREVRRREEDVESLTDFSEASASSICTSDATDVADVRDFDDITANSPAPISSRQVADAGESDDDDDNRLVVDYEFNEPQNDYFSLNGHVQDFINGDIGEDDEELLPQIADAVIPPVVISAAVPVAVVPHTEPEPVQTSAAVPSILQLTLQSLPTTVASSPPVVTPPQPCPQLIMHQPSAAGSFSMIHCVPMLTPSYNPQPQAAILSNIVPILQQPIPPPIAVPAIINPPVIPTPPPAIAYSLQVHNDMNDVQEISKILQTCHNGRDDTKKPQIKKKKTKSPSPALISTARRRIASPVIPQPPQQSLKNSIDEPLNVNNNSNSSGGSSKRSTSKKNEQKSSLNKKATQNSINHNNHIDIDGSSDTQLGENDENGNGGDDNNQDDNDDNNSNEEQKENIRLQNLEIRTTVFRDIRRPGRNYSGLLEHLELVRGNFDTKFNFIQMCINEALRFRRKLMADIILQWWEKQIEQELCTTTS